MRKPYVLVSGGIGVGKTKLVRQLSDELGLEAVIAHDADNPYLESFYGAQARLDNGEENPWAFRSQLWFLISGLRDLRRIAERSAGVLQERSAHEDFLVFAHELRDRGEINADDFTMLSDLYYAQAFQMPAPDLLVYLDAPLDVMAHRVSGRGVSRAYLQALRDRYEQFLDGWLLSPVMRLRTHELDDLGSAGEMIAARLEEMA